MDELLKGLSIIIVTSVHKQEVIVFDEPNRAKVMESVKRSLLAGSSVQYASEDGRTVWYENDWVTTPEKSYEPIWYKDGNKIRKKRIEVTRFKDGRQEKKILGEFWGAYNDD